MEAPPIMQTPPPTPRGMGCFAKGCLTLIVAGLILVALVVGGGLFVLYRAIHVFTSTEPVQIQVRPATPAELQVAEAKLDTLRSAVRNHQEATIEFNANEINALIANEAEFRGARGHMRVAITNSIASLDVSAPLDSMHRKRLKGRWFNGNVQFGFSYVDDNFNFDIRSAEANGHQFPGAILTSEVMRSFNRTVNESFHRESGKRADTNDLWRHIKMASLQNDKLVVTTRSM
jgi:hypothetical protein